MTKHWSVPVVVNVLLGIPGVAPFLLLWQAAHWPLTELGWITQEPTENDGMAVWLVYGLPHVAVYGLIWCLVRLLRRRTALAPRTYWLLSLTASLLPTVALHLDF
ncbi:hypothetical protein A4E84_16130 [Streptomyces qaidamensis]|uniref:Uncharacterized protein n=1 Tax=Streptomyces qaidamensis TaxID=1783515 RepID=A0A143C0J7_9ACTN|nr:hypothetical protein [Streptomyces qaidamensis]AMW10903.1 hypothetical protein A4E84_16130 [Streptomyces qaidamensis]